MKSNFLVILILLTGFALRAQSVISITPMVGLQQLVSKQISKKNTANTFRNNAYDELFDSGIFLDYKRNKWAISIGYMSGDAGFVYKVSTPDLKQRKEGITHVSTSVYALRRTPIKFSYTFKKLSLIPFAISREDTKFYLDMEKARNKNLYLFNFKLIGFAALSYNWALSDSTSYSYSSESYNMYSGDIITFNNTITYLRKRNLSLMVGLTFQFMHQNKERMAITLYYNQGLSSIIQADLHYKINGKPYNTSLDVKGSAIGINISYPFKLYDFEKRRRG